MEVRSRVPGGQTRERHAERPEDDARGVPCGQVLMTPPVSFPLTQENVDMCLVSSPQAAHGPGRQTEITP
jgi:hypothetical protein